MNIIKLIQRMFRKTPSPTFLERMDGTIIHDSAREEGTHVQPLDSKYSPVTLKSFVKYMGINSISEMPYIPEDHDCEDFAFETLVDVKLWAPGCQIGIVFGIDAENKPHSWNCFFDVEDGTLYYFEPQDDRLYLPTIEKEWTILI